MWVFFFEIGVNGDLKSSDCHKCTLDTHYMLAKMQFGLRFVNLFVVKSRESYLNSSTFIP